ncbi:MAG: hypothetical protein KDD47_07875 [Acidobacteria bacterium]|nr:hypothetical protein [Acidobacteriota bacterium]
MYSPPPPPPAQGKKSEPESAPPTAREETAPSSSFQELEFAPGAETEVTVIELDVIRIGKNYFESWISGRDRKGRKWTFRFRPDTRLRRLTPEEREVELSTAIREEKVFPLEKNQEIAVAWKKNRTSTSLVAERISALD